MRIAGKHITRGLLALLALSASCAEYRAAGPPDPVAFAAACPPVEVRASLQVVDSGGEVIRTFHNTATIVPFAGSWQAVQRQASPGRKAPETSKPVPQVSKPAPEVSPPGPSGPAGGAPSPQGSTAPAVVEKPTPTTGKPTPQVTKPAPEVVQVPAPPAHSQGSPEGTPSVGPAPPTPSTGKPVPEVVKPVPRVAPPPATPGTAPSQSSGSSVSRPLGESRTGFLAAKEVDCRQAKSGDVVNFTITIEYDERFQGGGWDIRDHVDPAMAEIVDAKDSSLQGVQIDRTSEDYRIHVPRVADAGQVTLVVAVRLR